MSKTKPFISKKEYFTNLCSPVAAVRSRIVTILAIICLAVQCLLCVQTVYGFNLLYNALENWAVQIHGKYIGESFVVFFFAASLICTVFAIKTKRTGLWIALAILAPLGLMADTNLLYGRDWNYIALFISLAIYLSFVVMNYLNNKEYKNYLQSNASDK